MTRAKHIARAGVAAVALVGALGGTQLVRQRRARADGPPTTNPLYATGIIFRGDTPLNGMQMVAAVLWDAETGGSNVCITRPMATVFQRGRFRLPLDSACTAAVRMNPNLWIELRLDTTTFPRSRLGVVPYAIEAGRASEASGALNDRLTALETPATDPDCPPGYTRSSSAPTGVVLCNRGRDEMVRVGSGAELFWIDRYEASLWTSADATGSVFGDATNNYPTTTFPPDGTYSTPLFAVSVTDTQPSRFLTWFQADAACRASGKRLPTNTEWTTAARRVSAGCVTSGSAPVAGSGTAAASGTCASAWGAQHMVGNVWEWTEEWQMQLGTMGAALTPWPAGFSSDSTVNLTGAPRTGAAATAEGLPAGVRRGGAYDSGANAGRLAYAVDNAPSFGEATAGVRCVIGP